MPLHDGSERLFQALRPPCAVIGPVSIDLNRRHPEEERSRRLALVTDLTDKAVIPLVYTLSRSQFGLITEVRRQTP